MAKTKISEFSSTPANNTDIDSINIAEGCAPSNINDAIRELMAQLKDFQIGSQGDSFNGPIGTSTAAAGAFTTLSASGSVTLSGGTANGVTYLNGSKVLTSGSALTFNASTLAIATAANDQLTWTSGRTGYLYADSAGIGIGDTALLSGNATYYNKTSNYIANYINGSEQMRLTSTGLGIGTSSPSAKLTVINASDSNKQIVFSDNATYYGSVAHNAGTGANEYRTEPSTGLHQFFRGTSSTADATIDSSGNLLVGTTSAQAKLTVNNTSQVYDWALNLQTVEDSPSSNNFYYVDFRNGSSTQTGYIWSNGGTTTSYATSSDYRLKENIAPITGALAKVSQLKPSTWTWKSNGQDGQGFIAHELQAICPDAVSGEKDGLDKDGNPRYQAVDTSFLVATLTAALQELNAKFDAYVATHP